VLAAPDRPAPRPHPARPDPAVRPDAGGSRGDVGRPQALAVAPPAHPAARPGAARALGLAPPAHAAARPSAAPALGLAPPTHAAPRPGAARALGVAPPTHAAARPGAAPALGLAPPARPAAPRRRAGAGLPADARRVAAVLGLYPGPAPDPGAVAALAGLSRAAARTALTRMTRAGLAVEAGGRYRPLVEPPPPPDADACSARLREHLLATATAACAVAAPGPAVSLPPFRSAAAARAWLDAERPTLLAITDPAFADRLAPFYAAHLDAAGHHTDATTLRSRAGLEAAARDRAGLQAGARRPAARDRAGLEAGACRPAARDRSADVHDAATRAHPGQQRNGRELVERARWCAERGRRVEALAWFAEAYELCALTGDLLGRGRARRGLTDPSLV
jgi:hypothetical protein